MSRLLFATATLVLCLASADASPLKIGVPLPLTGALQAYGQDVQRGFQLASEILHADNVTFIFEDDVCDATRSVTVNKKLIEIDRVDIVTGIYCNTALIPAAPLFNQAKVPVLTVGATSGDKKGIGSKIYRLFPADQLGVRPLIEHASKSASSMCSITELDAYSALIERTLSRDWPKLGPGFRIFSESVNGGERDFRAVLLRILRNKCDALMINSAGDDGFIAAFRQLRTINSSIPVYALYMPGSSTVQQALGKSLDGTVYADIPSHSEIATPLGETFINQYRRRFGDFQVGQPAALLAFEALRLIVESQKAGVPLDEFLAHRTVRDGAIREYSFDSDGAVQGIEFRVMAYRHK